jgi:hypothetical protein
MGQSTPGEGNPEGYGGLRRQVSLGLLVAVNLLPVLGVLFLDWDVAALVLLYWAENLVLGFYTLLRMLIKSPLGGLGMGAFFILHYGGFCAGHGIFILLMLYSHEFDPVAGEAWPVFLVMPQMLWNVLLESLTLVPSAWLVALGALFVSHGGSFVMNFLLGPEREQTTLGRLMGAPYGRIIILHVAILLGGFGAMALGEPLIVLLALVVLKTIMDYKLHLREHEAYALRATSGPIVVLRNT